MMPGFQAIMLPLLKLFQLIIDYNLGVILQYSFIRDKENR
jgi:hypothetical protein